jgi:RHS repeat-associated protein
VPNENPAGGGTFKYDQRFPGQIYDAQAGLHQNGFRDYDPQTGRYLESDLIGLIGGVDTYSYADGSPPMMIDPDGLSPIKLIKLCVKGYKVIRNISKQEAVKLAKKGDVDIVAGSHAEAREIARLASQGKKPIRDPIHPDRNTGSTEGRSPHYHTNPRNGSHIFYSIASALTAANYSSCKDCTEEKLLEAVDFLNPLAAPKDILDIWEEL